MNILFLVYHGLSEFSGISKKILAQIDGLKANGHAVHLCTYDILGNGDKARRIDGQVIQNYGNNWLSPIKCRISFSTIYTYAIEHHIDFVYARSFHNANPWTVRLFQRFKEAGIKTVIEIPTYPYDQEYATYPWKWKLGWQIDKLFRKALAQKTNKIVTFSDEKTIFGQRTIRISNGINFSSIPIKKMTGKTDDTIHFIAVAEVHYWHGLDRFIAGMGEYMQKPSHQNIIFHIIGFVCSSEMDGSEMALGFKTLITKYGLKKNVIFHGTKYGKELDSLFDHADFAVGSLGRHRSGIDVIKTLKNREYAARGMRFIYSETDEDFDNQPYIYKVPADESPINIERVLDFMKKCTLTSQQIRESITHLSWDNQMKSVLNQLE